MNRDTLRWSSRVQEKAANPGECGLHNASDNALRFVKENFLAEDVVRPVGRSLTLVSTEHSYSHLTVQRVQAANGRSYTNSETLVMGPESDEGRGRCPYDPYQRNTALIVDGELYTGTVADYRGNRPVISRHLGEGQRVDLKLDDTLGWLEDPTFISSSFIPQEEKIYFFFSEVGREYDFLDKFIVSRVSQICMSDVGGQRTLQRRWTTFAKAQLRCQTGSQLPYNVLQDMDLLPPATGAPPDDTLFYGIFTSQWSVNSGRSAVCSFRLKAGLLHKAVLLQSGPHIIEEITVFEQVQPVKSLKLSIPKAVIYVGGSDGVLRLPTANCSFYWSCAQCVLARDPQCGWDPQSRGCVGVSVATAPL
ncbi:unnamed protein product [Menidia menidia]|uniref:(Atlantic silverside) hypothetical protein n=1 Tax=Menidia menidia TaxID=238744 RepID=A0A8S4ASX1_9TELE|nr:unnamed protein product [Menidia menidia]